MLGLGQELAGLAPFFHAMAYPLVHSVIWKSALLMQGAAGLHSFQPRESLQDQLLDWIKDQVQLKSIDFEVKDKNRNATS